MEQRRNQIVELVNRKGSISFAQLKEAFPSVSEMTLRTDLKALDEARRVVRVHGGVKSVEQVVGTDDLLSRRAARNAEAKQIIAEKPLLCCAPTPPCFWIPAAPPQQWPGASRISPCSSTPAA